MSDGPTLGALAEQLEVLTERLGGLERENERMRSENDELRDKVAALEGTGQVVEEPDTVDRCTWTPRRRCGYARLTAPRARGGR